MKQQWKIKNTGLLLIIAMWISFPFFEIKYFETFSSFQIIYHYFLLPIVIVSTLGVIILYTKYLKKFNKPTNSKIKRALQDIFTITFLVLIFSGILCGLTVSTTVTTNAYLEPQKAISINETVTKYETDRTKWGRLRHYINFKNPANNLEIRLEVYRKYYVGEKFTKDMKIGKWGQLYSIE